ncbi:hypothetical protein [Endozoicomonas sp. Mp262]|uniref:hypothetical protein n=1 Tax=Endozoicomonas sp. Mp262 TaxID=2919499 RepID=UPI0021D9A684
MGPIRDFFMGEVRCGKAVFQLEAATQHFQQIIKNFNLNPGGLMLESLSDEQLLAIALNFDDLSPEAKCKLEKTPPLSKISAEKRLQQLLRNYQQTSQSSNNWQLSSFLKKPFAILAYWLLIARGVLPYVTGTWNQLAVSIVCGLFLFRNKYLESQTDVQSEHRGRLSQAKKLQDFLVEEVAIEKHIPTPETTLALPPPPIKNKVQVETQTDYKGQQDVIDLQKETPVELPEVLHLKQRIAELNQEIKDLNYSHEIKIDDSKKTIQQQAEEISQQTSALRQLHEEREDILVEIHEKEALLSNNRHLKEELNKAKKHLVDESERNTEQEDKLYQEINGLMTKLSNAQSRLTEIEQLKNIARDQEQEISHQASMIRKINKEKKATDLEIKNLKTQLDTDQKYLEELEAHYEMREKKLVREAEWLKKKLIDEESRNEIMEDQSRNKNSEPLEVIEEPTINTDSKDDFTDTRTSFSSSVSSTNDTPASLSIDHHITLFSENRELFITEFFNHIDRINLLKDRGCEETYRSLANKHPEIFTNCSLTQHASPLTEEKLKIEITKNIQEASIDSYQAFIKDFFSIPDESSFDDQGSEQHC